MRDVKMPDGNVIKSVPDDVSEEDVLRDYARYSSKVAKKEPVGFERVPRMLGTVLKGAGFGAAESAAITGGALAGAGLGAAATPLVGAGIPGGIAGALIGGYSGYKAAQGIEEYEPKTFPSNEARAAFEGAKTFGGGLGGAGALRSAVRAAPAAFPRVLKEMTSRSAPAYYVSEAASSGYAGVAGGISVGLAPENHVLRFFAELGAGTFNTPQALNMASTSTPLKDSARRMLGSFSKDAQEARASKVVTGALEKAGEDIPALVSRLEAKSPGRVPTSTAAQQTGSPTLAALESALSRSNSAYAEGIRAQAKQASDAYEGMIQSLERTGDPQALREAAELKKQKYEAALDAQLGLLKERAAMAAAQIPPLESSDVARQAAGEIIKRETLNALSNARKYESSLWKTAERGVPPAARTETGTSRNLPAVPGTRKIVRASVVPSNLRAKVLEEAASIGPLREGSDLSASGKVTRLLGISPSDVAKYREGQLTDSYINTGVVPQEFISYGKDMSVDTLVRVRSDLLKMARDAAASENLSDARAYSKLAEAALDDLGAVNLPGYDEARAFSRALNDSYRRTFASAMRKVDRSGADIFSPEVLVQKAFNVSNDQTALRLSEIEDAVGLMARQYERAVLDQRPDAEDLAEYAAMSREGVASVMEAERNIYRLAAKQTLGPDGRVNPARMEKFIDQNSAILDRLGMTEMLQDATVAENALRSALDGQSALNKAVQKQAAFSTILKNENPTLAVASVLSEGTPKGLVRLSRLVKNNSEASDGLKSSVYQYAFDKAGGSTNFDPEKYVQTLFGPMGHRQPSIVATLRNQGLMSSSEVKNILSLVRPLRRISGALQTKGTLEGLSPESAFDDFAASWLGASIGSKVAPEGPGSLVVSSRAAGAMRNVMNKIPALAMRNILEEATKDPKMMSLLLKKTANMSPKQLHEHTRAVNAYLGAAGLNYAQALSEQELLQNAPTDDEEAEATAAKDGTARTLLERLLTPSPAVPTTRGMPGAQTPAAPAPAAPAAPAPGGAPNSQSRMMLEQLFPNDQLLKGLIPPAQAAVPPEEQQPPPVEEQQPVEEQPAA